MRVFRRRNAKDVRDFKDREFNFENLQDFIMKATFVGPTPFIMRELSTENAMKIFTYNKPVLIMFRNTTLGESRFFEEELGRAYKEIENQILVCVADINSNIGTKIAALCGLDTDLDTFP